MKFLLLFLATFVVGVCAARDGYLLIAAAAFALCARGVCSLPRGEN